jgi:hypothetical protein
MMKPNLTLREKIAMEIERQTNTSAVDWDDEQLYRWCFDEQFGGKFFGSNLTLAEHLMASFDIKEK